MGVLLFSFRHATAARSLSPPLAPPPDPKTTGTVRCDAEKDAFVSHYKSLQASYDYRAASAAKKKQAEGQPRWRPPDERGEV